MEYTSRSKEFKRMTAEEKKLEMEADVLLARAGYDCWGRPKEKDYPKTWKSIKIIS